MKLGLKNLFQEKTKLAISVGGIACALLLILILGGIFTGFERQATAYIINSKASLWVMQKGVANMHMANTVLPAGRRDAIIAVPGVRRVAAILYLSGYIKIKGAKTLSYVVGYDRGEFTGGPWSMAKGKKDLSDDQVILAESLAAKRGVGVGDTITVLGRRMEIAGLSRETFSMANTITFVNRDAMESMIHAPGRRSYFLVSVDRGRNPGKVAAKIEQRVGGVNAMTAPAFAQSERRLIRQMGIDMINAMSVIGFIIGVMVVGLTIFTATLEKSRDYGILKAVGAARWRLYLIVFEQALISVALGFIAGLGLAVGARLVIERLFPEMQLAFAPGDIAKAAIAMVAIAILASYVPIRRVAKLDPMIVFKS
ncbi:MAG: ABC transporter permease [Actinomycetota bacterium]|nr:ABC transporter permease [Actinomycetota bacterium]